jgi:hypothetical protein
MKVLQRSLSSTESMSLNDDLFHGLFDGTAIQATCKCGKSDFLDRYPRFSTLRPGNYLLRTARFRCDCNPTRTSMHSVPRDTSLPFFKGNRQILLSFNQQQNASLEDNNIVRPLLIGPSAKMGLPDVVETWCIVHKSETLTKDGRIGPIRDIKPRFTIGHSRHLYLERTASCYRCIATRGYHSLDSFQKMSRFLPSLYSHFRDLLQPLGSSITQFKHIFLMCGSHRQKIPKPAKLKMRWRKQRNRLVPHLAPPVNP